LLAEDEEFHGFAAFDGGAFDGCWGVAVGGDEEVTVDVGVFVEHEHAVFCAGEDEVLVVKFGGFGGGAEEAVFRAVGDGFDVVESPGGVEGVHRIVVSGQWSVVSRTRRFLLTSGYRLLASPTGR
jgi:hypothetical protein